MPWFESVKVPPRRSAGVSRRRGHGHEVIRGRPQSPNRSSDSTARSTGTIARRPRSR